MSSVVSLRVDPPTLARQSPADVEDTGSRPQAAIVGVFEARHLRQSQPQTAAPRLDRQEVTGRLVELSAQGASALLTLGVGLVLDTQRAGEPTAWVMVGGDSFFPPDVAAAGVDLEALAVVRAPDTSSAVAAAARLARSGAFGLIVVDLSRATDPSRDRVPTALLSRLVGLSQTHDMGVVFLTSKPAEQTSLDSLISLRGDVRREASLGSGRFVCALEVLKDKRRGPGWSSSTAVRGPAGLW